MKFDHEFFNTADSLASSDRIRRLIDASALQVSERILNFYQVMLSDCVQR
jgi:small neutral amino acid transporter SnatA (MarC family)